MATTSDESSSDRATNNARDRPRRGLVSTDLGYLHWESTGSMDASSSPVDAGPKPTPILAFHMSPRSTDEYSEAMPILSSSHQGRGTRLVVAVDEPGYGKSDNPGRSCTLDEIADSMLRVADELGIRRFVAAGSLVGCYVALSLASRYPDRVRAVVCTNLYYYPDGAREKAASAAASDAETDGEAVPIEDSWILKGDGSHLSDIWSKRSSFLDPDLNTRAVADELTYLLKRGERYRRGISIQDASSFDLRGAARGVRCPVLLVRGVAAAAFFDSIGYDMTGQFTRAVEFFDDAPVVRIEDVDDPGSINLINQNTREWSEKVLEFLADMDL